MNELVMMRVESNYAPRTFQQLRLVLLRGLTYRLYLLHHRVEAIKSKLEVRAVISCHRHMVDDSVSAGD
jgi:hypothetical protein